MYCNLIFLSINNCLDLYNYYLCHLISYAVVDSIDKLFEEVDLAIY